MKPCQWKQCGGWMKEMPFSYRGGVYIAWVCGKCGRSDNLEYEIKIEKEQSKSHRNWHFYRPSGMHLRVHQVKK